MHKRNSLNRLLIIPVFGLTLTQHHMFDYPGGYYHTPFQRPIDDLLRDQRQGKFLNFHEKQRVKKYAEENRKKNANKR